MTRSGYDPMVSVDVSARETASPFATIEDAIDGHPCPGKFVIVVDDEDRENEGDLRSRRSSSRPSP